MSETFRPGLYPKGGMPAPAPESEKKVYKALTDALPTGWSAWHSVKLRGREGEDAEADFVIARPGSLDSPPGAAATAASAPSPTPSASPSSVYPQPAGILILEVKGGAIHKKDGLWYQSGKPMDKTPRSQAVRARVSLLSEFDAHGITPPAIGEIAVFPDQDYDAPPTQGDLEGLVVGARNLPYLEELLPEIMKRALPGWLRSRRPSPGWIELLHNLWCECWPLKPKLALQAGSRLEERVKLDTTQFSTLSSAIENDLVLVRGGAGTGKTILAAELARREAQTGRRVLFLTFTEALAFELAKELPDPLITVSPVGRFALEHLRKGGFDKLERYEPEFWDRVTERAGRWRSRSLWKDCAFATVIIDEAQDFGRDEWRIATRCASARKRIWAFMDESQAFWQKRRIPASFLKKCTRLNLQNPYRCPPSIQALAEAYLGKGAAADAIRPGLEDGTIAIVVSPKDKVHEEVGREIGRLLTQGFKPSDIAVISLRGRMFEQNIMHRKELGGYMIVQATDERAKDHIVCDTFLRFKGLERLAVVVTDLNLASERYSVRMNIAVSRAVGVLRIVGASEEIEKDEVLTGIF